MAATHSLPETSAQHTPGPWRIGEGLRGYDFGIVKPIAMGVIGIADIPEGIHRGEAEANARLIAAAPELLDVLKRIVNAESLLTAWALARGAIAKAETPSSSRS